MRSSPSSSFPPEIKHCTTGLHDMNPCDAKLRLPCRFVVPIGLAAAAKKPHYTALHCTSPLQTLHHTTTALHWLCCVISTRLNRTYAPLRGLCRLQLQVPCHHTACSTPETEVCCMLSCIAERAAMRSAVRKIPGILKSPNRQPPPTAANRRQPPTIVQFCFCGFVSCPCLDHEAASVPVNVRFFWRYEPFFSPQGQPWFGPHVDWKRGDWGSNPEEPRKGAGRRTAGDCTRAGLARSEGMKDNLGLMRGRTGTTTCNKWVAWETGGGPDQRIEGQCRLREPDNCGGCSLICVSFTHGHPVRTRPVRLGMYAHVRPGAYSGDLSAVSAENPSDPPQFRVRTVNLLLQGDHHLHSPGKAAVHSWCDGSCVFVIVASASRAASHGNAFQDSRLPPVCLGRSLVHC